MTVAALQTRFWSFESAVLPSSFKFAVIENTSGDVLFHSDDRLSLIENFFLETDQDMALQAAAAAHRHEHINGHYKGIAHHFYVEPILDVPWSLVVFYDKSLVQTVIFELGLTAIIFLFIYMTPFVIGVAIVKIFVPEPRWSWLWPQWNRETQYGNAVAFLVLLSILYALGIWSFEGWRLVGLLFTMPLFIIGLLYLTFTPRIAIYKRRGWAEVALVTGASGIVATFLLDSVLAWEFQALFVCILLLLFVVTLLVILDPLSIRSKRSGPTRQFRQRYLTAGLLTVLLLSILPSLVIFKDAFRVHTNILTKYSQHQISRALSKRQQILLDYTRSLNPNILGPVKLGEEARCNGIYDQQSEEWNHCERKKTAHLSRPSLRCEAKLEHRPWENAVNSLCCGDWDTKLPRQVEELPSEDLNTEQGELVGEGLAAWLPTSFPAYNALAAKLHTTVYGQASDGEWAWVDCSKRKSSIRVSEGNLAFLFYWIGADWTPRHILRSEMYKISDLLVKSSWVNLLLAIFPFALFLLVLYVLVRFLANRILGLRLPNFEILENRYSSIEDWIKKNRILIRPPAAFLDTLLKDAKREKVSVMVIDLQEIGRWNGLWLDPRGFVGRRAFIVKNFELCFSDSQWRKNFLIFLEGLILQKDPVLKRRRVVLLCSGVSPLYPILTPEAYPDAEGNNVSADEGLRWSKLLEAFQTERFIPPSPKEDWKDWKETKERWKAVLVRECFWSEELQRIGATIQTTQGWENLTDDQIAAQVGDQAGGYYHQLWTFCTKEERLFLIGLAQGKLVNPRRTDVLEHLIRRGLIQRTPNFRLINKSFQRFVLLVEPQERVAEWEREAAESTWSVLQVPLLIALLLLAAFIAFVGGDTIRVVVTTLTTVLAGVPALTRALTVLRGSGSGPGGGG